MIKKIFISHSSKDIFYVEKIIDLLELMGVSSNQIFCSSFEGYGIELGEDFLQTIKNELNDEVLVLFILSENFFKSPVCLCEMGAVWVKTREHIPILLPSFEFNQIKGVIPNTQGMKINDSSKMNSLKTKIESLFNIKPVDFSIWERKRNNILKLISEGSQTNSSKESNVPNTQNDNEYIDISEYNDSIRQQSEIEWPNDFEMRVHYIEKQRTAIEKLNNHRPTDISRQDFKLIREKAKNEWPLDFEMRFYTEENQVESLRKFKSL